MIMLRQEVQGEPITAAGNLEAERVTGPRPAMKFGPRDHPREHLARAPRDHFVSGPMLNERWRADLR